MKNKIITVFEFITLFGMIEVTYMMNCEKMIFGGKCEARNSICSGILYIIVFLFLFLSSKFVPIRVKKVTLIFYSLLSAALVFVSISLFLNKELMVTFSSLYVAGPFFYGLLEPFKGILFQMIPASFSTALFSLIHCLMLIPAAVVYRK